MEKQDWIDTFNRSKNELRELVEQFHPSSKAKVREGAPTVEVPAGVILLPCPITAPTAEEACEVVRKQIQRTKPQNPLTIFDTLAEDPALHTKELTSLLSGAWFGMPESRSVRSLPGFFELCDLCEGVDEEEDTEDLAV